jgi:hypothetical protein
MQTLVTLLFLGSDFEGSGYAAYPRESCEDQLRIEGGKSIAHRQDSWGAPPLKAGGDVVICHQVLSWQYFREYIPRFGLG